MCIGNIFRPSFHSLSFDMLLIFYAPIKSKLQHLPRNPSGISIFGKFLFKFHPLRVKELFKCPIIGPFKVIKCTHTPGELRHYYFNFSVASIMFVKPWCKHGLIDNTKENPGPGYYDAQREQVTDNQREPVKSGQTLVSNSSYHQ